MVVPFAIGLGISERKLLAAITGVFVTLLLVAGAAAVRLVAVAGPRGQVECAVDAGLVCAGAEPVGTFEQRLNWEGEGAGRAKRKSEIVWGRGSGGG